MLMTFQLLGLHRLGGEVPSDDMCLQVASYAYELEQRAAAQALPIRMIS